MYQNNNSNIAETAQQTASQVKDQGVEITQKAYTSVTNLVNSLAEQLPYIVAGILVIIFFYIIAKIAKAIFLATSKKTHLDERLRILFGRLLVVFICVLGIFASLTIIIPNFSFGQLIAGLGFTSFIVGFATKDILNNLLSGILILWQQPFKVGDYLFIKDKEGVVDHIGVRATELKMFDGERILIPNGDMYSSALTIRSAGAFRRIKLNLTIGYESKVSDSKEKILDALSQIEGVLDDPPPAVYVTDLGTEGVKLTVYFWINTDESSPLVVFDEASSNVNRVLRDADVKLFPPPPMVLQDSKVSGE